VLVSMDWQDMLACPDRIAVVAAVVVQAHNRAVVCAS
jgi:hypothetical protein